MSKVVSGEDSAKVKRWQVPDVTPGFGGGTESGHNKYITAVQLERIQKQAYEEAYARGLREGIAAGQAQVKDRARQFVNLANLLQSPLKEASETIENELLQLSLVIAKQIIRREITLDPGHIVSVIREGVAALPESTQKITIRLHPEDAATVRTVLAESNEETLWRLQEDPSLVKGDCRISTEYSQVDATLETRLAAVAAKLVGEERKQDLEDE